jgi:hypothetical protein
MRSIALTKRVGSERYCKVNWMNQPKSCEAHVECRGTKYLLSVPDELPELSVASLSPVSNSKTTSAFGSLSGLVDSFLDYGRSGLDGPTGSRAKRSTVEHI